ncbi:MAG: hypothetical protein NC911_05660 [Candidatus Omnitrophica bacterium]|nr:hypothetical protein [Candidatus Omnitrophota bacterium]
MITRRALVIGFLLSFLIASGEPWVLMYLQGSPLCADFSTGGAIFLFFLFFFLIHCSLKRFFPKRAFSPTELATIYIMMIVACAIPSWGFTMNLIGLLAGTYYYASPANRYAQLIHPHIPSHLVPSNLLAVQYFYEGLPPGVRIPWAVWIKPLAHWFTFIIIFYLLCVSLVVVMRKQWVEREKLMFPLMELPEVMVTETRRFCCQKLLWLGFFIPLFFYSLNGLHVIFPLFTSPKLAYSLPIFRRTFSLPITLYFEVIGLSFLVPTDVLFSVWFFSILLIFVTGFLQMVGFSIGPFQPYSDPAHEAISCQSIGALVVLSLYSLWVARDHLKTVIVEVKNRNQRFSQEEIMSYRTCFWCFWFSLIFCVWWIRQTGLNLLPTIFFTFITILIFLGITRVIAQTGLAYYRAPVIPAVMTVHTFGSQVLGPSGLTSLGLSFAWAADLRTMVMASVCNALKLATTLKINSRRLLLGISLAIVISLLASSWSTLFLGYKCGAINIPLWHLKGLPKYAMGWISRLILHPQSVGLKQYGFITLGGALMLLFLTLRHFFLWWPLSPVGLAVGIPYPVYMTWFSVFLAWVAKVMVLKYGGAQVYQKAKFFSLGLVLGSFVTAGLWNLIAFVTKTPGIKFTLG